MDKYDEAIAFLTANPDEIATAWTIPINHAAGCLFQFATPDGFEPCIERPDGRVCSCLTCIRSQNNDYVAWTDELTREILADERIPKSVVTVADLPVFAEWQRRLDKEIRS